MFENDSSVFPANKSLITNELLNNTEQDCFTADSTAAIVLKSLAYLIILLVSLVGNVLVILVVWKNKHSRIPIDSFVANMAVSDLFTPLTTMPIKVAEIISGSGAFMVHSPLMFGNILCKLCYLLPDVSVLISVESLLLISFDSFMAVVFPLKFRCITPKVRLICIGCTWTIAIAVHAPYFYTLRLFPDGNEYYCEYDWEPAFDHDETSKRYITATFLAIIDLPICILIIVYGVIAWFLKRRSNQREERGEISETASPCGHQQNMQIIRLSVAIAVAFVFSMVPHFVFMFCTIFLWRWDDPPICAFQTVIPFAALFMVHSWSAFNPCIYFIFSTNYCRRLKMLFLREDRLERERETRRARSGASTSV